MGNSHSSNYDNFNDISGGSKNMPNMSLKEIQNKIVQLFAHIGIMNKNTDVKEFLKTIVDNTNPSLKELNNTKNKQAIENLKDFMVEALGMDFVKSIDDPMVVLKTAFQLLNSIVNGMTHDLSSFRANLDLNVDNLSKMVKIAESVISKLKLQNTEDRVPKHKVDKMLIILDHVVKMIRTQKDFLSILLNSAKLKDTEVDLSELTSSSDYRKTHLSGMRVNDAEVSKMIMLLLNTLGRGGVLITDIKNIQKLTKDKHLDIPSKSIPELEKLAKDYNLHLNEPSIDNITQWITSIYRVIEEKKKEQFKKRGGVDMGNELEAMLLNKNSVVMSSLVEEFLGSADSITGGIEPLRTTLRSMQDRYKMNKSQIFLVLAKTFNKELLKLGESFSGLQKHISPSDYKLNEDLERYVKRFLIFQTFRTKSIYLALVGYFSDVQSKFLREDFLSKVLKLQQLSKEFEVKHPNIKEVRDIDNQLKVIHASISDLSVKFKEKFGGDENERYRHIQDISILEIPDLTDVNNKLIKNVVNTLYSIRLKNMTSYIKKFKLYQSDDYDKLVGQAIAEDLDKVREDYQKIMSALSKFEEDVSRPESNEVKSDNAITLNHPVFVYYTKPTVDENGGLYHITVEGKGEGIFKDKDAGLKNDYKLINKIFLELPQHLTHSELADEEGENLGKRDVCAWGRKGTKTTKWVDPESQDDNVTLGAKKLNGIQLLSCINNYKEFVKLYYESYINLVYAAQGLDQYLKHFTDKIRINPELIEKLELLLENTNIAAVLFDKTKVTKLVLDILDPNEYHLPDNSHLVNGDKKDIDVKNRWEIENNFHYAYSDLKPMVDLIFNRVPSKKTRPSYLEVKKVTATDGTVSNIPTLRYTKVTKDDPKSKGGYPFMLFTDEKRKEPQFNTAINKILNTKEFYKNNTILKNILSIFFNLLKDSFTDNKEQKYMEPKAILNAMMNYLSFGIYKFTYTKPTHGLGKFLDPISGKLIEDTDKEENISLMSLIDNDNLSVFNENYTAMNILDTNVRVGMVNVNDVDFDNFPESRKTIHGKGHNLLMHMLKAITAKTLTLLGLYDIRDYKNNKAYRVNLMDPTRVVLGGAPRNYAVREEYSEFYVRLPLIVEFYRMVFYDSIQKDSSQNDIHKTADDLITLTPELKEPFGNIFRHIFLYFQNKSVVDYNETEMREIIADVNDIIMFFKDKADKDVSLLKFVIYKMIEEVNHKYGILNRFEYNKYLEKTYEYLNLRHYNVNEVSSFDLVDDALFTDDGLMNDNLPSDLYSTKPELINTQNISSAYTKKFNVSGDYQVLKTFRQKVFSLLLETAREDNFIQAYNTQATLFGLDEILSELKLTLKNSKNDQEKFKHVFKLISSTSSFQKIDTMKMLVIHEFIVTQLKIVNNILSFLEQLRVRFSNKVTVDGSVEYLAELKSTFDGAKDIYLKNKSLDNDGTNKLLDTSKVRMKGTEEGSSNLSALGLGVGADKEIEHDVFKLLRKLLLHPNICEVSSFNSRIKLDLTKLEQNIEKQMTNLISLFNDVKLHLHDKDLIKYINDELAESFSKYELLFKTTFSTDSLSNPIETINNTVSNMEAFLNSDIKKHHFVKDDTNNDVNDKNIDNINDLAKYFWSTFFISHNKDKNLLNHYRIVNAYSESINKRATNLSYPVEVFMKRNGPRSRDHTLDLNDLIYVEPHNESFSTNGLFDFDVISYFNNILGNFLKGCMNEDDKKIYKLCPEYINYTNDNLNNSIDNRLSNIQTINYLKTGLNYSVSYDLGKNESNPYLVSHKRLFENGESNTFDVKSRYLVFTDTEANKNNSTIIDQPMDRLSKSIYTNTPIDVYNDFDPFDVSNVEYSINTFKNMLVLCKKPIIKDGSENTSGLVLHATNGDMYLSNTDVNNNDDIISLGFLMNFKNSIYPSDKKYNDLPNKNNSIDMNYLGVKLLHLDQEVRNNSILLRSNATVVRNLLTNYDSNKDIKSHLYENVAEIPQKTKDAMLGVCNHTKYHINILQKLIKCLNIVPSFDNETEHLNRNRTICNNIFSHINALNKQIDIILLELNDEKFNYGENSMDNFESIKNLTNSEPNISISSCLFNYLADCTQYPVLNRNKLYDGGGGKSDKPGINNAPYNPHIGNRIINDTISSVLQSNRPVAHPPADTDSVKRWRWLPSLRPDTGTGAVASPGPGPGTGASPGTGAVAVGPTDTVASPGTGTGTAKLRRSRHPGKGAVAPPVAPPSRILDPKPPLHYDVGTDTGVPPRTDVGTNTGDDDDAVDDTAGHGMLYFANPLRPNYTSLQSALFSIRKLYSNNKLSLNDFTYLKKVITLLNNSVDVKINESLFNNILSTLTDLKFHPDEDPFVLTLSAMYCNVTETGKNLLDNSDDAKADRNTLKKYFMKNNSLLLSVEDKPPAETLPSNTIYNINNISVSLNRDNSKNEENNLLNLVNSFLLRMYTSKTPLNPFLNKDYLIRMNILDLNIMPIDINAMSREIPLAYLFNYASSFDDYLTDMTEGSIISDQILDMRANSSNRTTIESIKDLCNYHFKQYSDASNPRKDITFIYDTYLKDIIKNSKKFDIKYENIDRMLHYNAFLNIVQNIYKSTSAYHVINSKDGDGVELKDYEHFMENNNYKGCAINNINAMMYITKTDKAEENCYYDLYSGIHRSNPNNNKNGTFDRNSGFIDTRIVEIKDKRNNKLSGNIKAYYPFDNLYGLSALTGGNFSQSITVLPELDSIKFFNNIFNEHVWDKRDTLKTGMNDILTTVTNPAGFDTDRNKLPHSDLNKDYLEKCKLNHIGDYNDSLKSIDDIYQFLGRFDIRYYPVGKLAEDKVKREARLAHVMSRFLYSENGFSFTFSRHLYFINFAFNLIRHKIKRESLYNTNKVIQGKQYYQDEYDQYDNVMYQEDSLLRKLPRNSLNNGDYTLVNSFNASSLNF